MGELFGGTTKTVTQDTTQQRNPFAAAAPNITSILQGAGNLNFTPTQSAATQQGIAALQEQAGAPSVGSAAGAFGRELLGGPAGEAATDALTRTARGEFLGGNPFLQELVQRNTARTIDAINSQFSGIGQRGGPANQKAIADAMARGELSVLANNFARERGLQQQAAQGLLGSNIQVAGLSPTLDQASLFGPNTLLRAGAIQDAFQREQQLAPFRALQAQAALTNPIASAFGVTSNQGTTTQTQETPLGSQLLGAGLTLGGSFLGGPGGAAAGNALGGLFGLR